MSFIITLYTIKDSKNTIGKTLENGTNYSVNLKEQYSIDDLQILIHTTDTLITYNYCYIPQLKRYYFINDIQIFPNGIYRLYLHIDVLETYKDDILNCTCTVFDSNTNIEKIDSSITLDKNNNLILVTIGGV